VTSRKDVELLGPEMRIPPEHLPVLVARDERDMFDREAGLEKASGTDRQRAKWKLASERKGRAPMNPRPIRVADLERCLKF